MEQDKTILENINNFFENGIPINFKLNISPEEKMQILFFVLGIIAIIVILKQQKLL